MPVLVIGGPKRVVSDELVTLPSGDGPVMSFSKALASSGLELKVVARCFFIGLPISFSFGKDVFPNMLWVMLIAPVVALLSRDAGGVSLPTGVLEDLVEARASSRGSEECWRLSCWHISSDQKQKRLRDIP